MKRCAFCLLVVLGFGAGSMSSHAQKMYRCGSNYQDKPCAQGQATQIIGQARNESNSPAIDAACRRRSEAAKKMIWSRKGGASKDDLLAGAANLEEARLIEEVYAIKGDYNQIRKTIETECMAAKDLGPDSHVSAETTRLAREVQDKLHAEQRAAQGDDGAVKRGNSKPKNASLCTNYQLQNDVLDAGIKASGDQATIQAFQKKKEELSKARAAAACL